MEKLVSDFLLCLHINSFIVYGHFIKQGWRSRSGRPGTELPNQYLQKKYKLLLVKGNVASLPD